MPVCCMPSCQHQKINGVKLHRFPTDPQRRNIWAQNTGRKNWTPSVNSKICGAHFDNNQFENKRQDGKRKLRPDAVPTLFGGNIIPTTKIKTTKIRIEANEEDYELPTEENFRHEFFDTLGNSVCTQTEDVVIKELSHSDVCTQTSSYFGDTPNPTVVFTFCTNCERAKMESSKLRALLQSEKARGDRLQKRFASLKKLLAKERLKKKQCKA